MSTLSDILRSYSAEAADRIEWLEALVDRFAELHGCEDDCGRCFACGRDHPFGVVGDKHYDDCPTLVAFKYRQHLKVV